MKSTIDLATGFIVDNWNDDNMTWVKKMEQIDIWNHKLVSIRKELISSLARTIIPKKVTVVDDESTKEVERLYEELYNSSLDKLLNMSKDNNVCADKIIDRHRFFK